jgi:hypothetical protein
MLKTLLKKHSVIGIIGNRGQAKTSLALTLISNLKEQYPSLNVAVFGTEEKLNKTLKEAFKITILESKMDLLDLNLKDSIIFIDEFALFFDTSSQSKEQNKLMRFFDRLEHQNCKIIISTAREGFYNKFMCSRVTAFLVKQVEYDALVNGTWIKERVKAINSASDYRLEVSKSYYYLVTAGDTLTEKYWFNYLECFDSKKDNKDLFSEIKSEINSEIFSEIQKELRRF